jgi:hypothetical protein
MNRNETHMGLIIMGICISASILGSVLFGKIFTQTEVTNLIQEDNLIGYKVEQEFRFPWEPSTIWLDYTIEEIFPKNETYIGLENGNWYIFETIKLVDDNDTE